MKLGGITEAARAEVEHHGCLCLQPILCGTKQRQLTSVQVMYNQQPLYCPRQIPCQDTLRTDKWCSLKLVFGSFQIRSFHLENLRKLRLSLWKTCGGHFGILWKLLESFWRET